MPGAIGAAAKKLGNMTDDKKKGGKGKDFMHGLKEWITSPGGIITVVMFVAALWYIQHKTAPKGKAA